MERGAHERGFDNVVTFDQARQIVALELGQPRPQADIWRHGELRLHADQPLDGGGHRNGRALQE